MLRRQDRQADLGAPVQRLPHRHRLQPARLDDPDRRPGNRERLLPRHRRGTCFCFDKDGKVVWQRQLTEEFGRVTGYGGRIVSPIFDSGLVIVGMVNASWGDQARGRNRFVAFDGKTGEVVWWSSPPRNCATNPSYRSAARTTRTRSSRSSTASGCSSPAGPTGTLHAFKVRTGERVWSYRFSAGVVNPSPVVDGNLVYISPRRGEPRGRHPRPGHLPGRLAGRRTRSRSWSWEYRRSNRFGLSSPALADGMLYVPDDSSELFSFDAKKGGNGCSGGTSTGPRPAGRRSSPTASSTSST